MPLPVLSSLAPQRGPDNRLPDLAIIQIEAVSDLKESDYYAWDAIEQKIESLRKLIINWS
jgi:hypothetical protein